MLESKMDVEQAQLGCLLDLTLSKRNKIEEGGKSYQVDISWALICIKTDEAEIVHLATSVLIKKHLQLGPTSYSPGKVLSCHSCFAVIALELVLTMGHCSWS